MLAYISKSFCYVPCLEYVYAFNFVCVGGMFSLHPMQALTLYVFVACFDCTLYGSLFLHVYPCMRLMACLPLYLYNVFFNILECGHMLYFIHACSPFGSGYFYTLAFIRYKCGVCFEM